MLYVGFGNATGDINIDSVQTVTTQDDTTDTLTEFVKGIGQTPWYKTVTQ